MELQLCVLPDIVRRSEEHLSPDDEDNGYAALEQRGHVCAETVMARVNLFSR